VDLYVHSPICLHRVVKHKDSFTLPFTLTSVWWFDIKVHGFYEALDTLRRKPSDTHWPGAEGVAGHTWHRKFPPISGLEPQFHCGA
jgi:hypothetical protein